jgi:hypothetical protein
MSPRGRSLATVTVVLVCALLRPLTALGQDAAAPSDLWPRAVVVVFERRIPAEVARRGGAGARLRELRRAVTRVVAQNARSGDHVFVFADGMTQPDFECLLRGVDCQHASAGARPVVWRNGPAAVRSFVSRMLRLPEGPRGPVPAAVVHRDGAEFLHLAYDGNATSLDCLIRREVTAPMTMAPTFTDGAQCPTEGDETNPAETRAFSRVELSMAVQFSTALSSMPADRPAGRVLWVWALLRDKNYRREDTVSGIRLDFGGQSAPIEAYFNQVDRSYRIVRDRVDAGPTGPYVRLFDAQSDSTERLLENVHASPDLVVTRLGNQNPVVLPPTLEIGRGFLREPWSPAVDELRFDAELAPRTGGQVMSGVLTLANGSTTAATRARSEDGRHVRFVLPDADRTYRSALKTWLPNLRFLATFDLLVAGADSPAEYQFVTIPAVHRLSREIHVVAHLPSVREIVTLAALLAAVAYVLARVLRPLPIELALSPETLDWHLPIEGDASRLVRVGGYTDYFHRRWRSATTNVRMEWAFFSPVGLPIQGAEPPVAVTWGTERVAPDAPMPDRAVAWKPGTRTVPTAIDSMSVTLDERRFGSLALSTPQDYGCLIKLRLRAAPRVFPPLQARDRAFYVPLQIRIHEVQPAPTIDVNVDSIYRSLGVDCPARLDFASLTISNRLESGRSGVPRSIEVSATVELDEEYRNAVRVSFDDRASGRSGTVRGNADATWRLWLEPVGFVSPGDSRAVSGIVSVTWREPLGGATETQPLPWAVTWVPARTRLVGLDLGTSGARMSVQVADSRQDRPVRFPMGAINAGDTVPVPEFPAMVLIDDANGGRVVRAGEGPHGIHEEGARFRFVASAKSNLLAADGDPAAIEQARRDLESYVAALVLAWKEIRVEQRIQHAKLVVTVPLSYDAGTTRCYERLVRKYFEPEGIVLVASVREAEAAAYFYLLAEKITYEGQQSRFPQDRLHRTVVIDLGAGTVDLAVIAVSSSQGTVSALQTEAHTHSLWAGDRYDECLLEKLFGWSDARQRLQEDRRLRDEVRRFKRTALTSLLDGGEPTRFERLGTPVTADRTSFLDMMKPFFEQAITRPLSQLAERLGGERPYLDEVLLAGRGIYAVGCRERIRDEVQRLFEPHADGPPTIAMQSFGESDDPDVPWAIVRGAVTFGRSGNVMIGESDVKATRDLWLLVSSGGSVYTRPVSRVGERMRARRTFAYTFEHQVEWAWVVAGMLSESRAKQVYKKLSMGLPLDGDGRVVATWMPRAGHRRLGVIVTADEQASFEV